MTRPILAGLAAFLIATPALAASDLAVSIPTPAPMYVYDSGTIEVQVDNIGNRSAKNVELIIELPETNTSPQVFVMGDVSNIDSKCSLVDTELVCNLGKIGKNKSKTVTFDMELPQAAQSLDIVATASTTSNENTTGNNDASVTPPLLNYDVSVMDGDVATVEHCTGQGLVSFFECLTSPSSLSTHWVEFGNGTLSFPGQDPSFGGTWSQPSTDSLEMTYTQNGTVVAQFLGYGTSPGCFEGLTVFPGSPWVSPYEVCI